MDIKKAIKIMKILVLLAGLLFLVMYVSFDTSDCDACSFNGNKINKFMNKYSEECFQKLEVDLDISYDNPSNQYSEYPN